MPLYEYQCVQCGRFEVIQKFSDAPLQACPTCSGEVQKLLSAPAFQFKGTGWYITDYARKGGDGAKAEAGKTDSGAKADAGKTDSGAKSETTKPAAAGATSATSSSDSTSAAPK